MPRWAWEGFRAAGSPRSLGRNRRGKPRWLCKLSPKRKRRADRRRLSTRSTRSILAMRENLGVNVDDLLVSQPDCGEQALEITNALVQSAAIDVLVVDSVAALVPRAELEGEMGDSFMGLHARLMSQATKKALPVPIAKTNNLPHIYQPGTEKIGVVFGNPGNDHWRPGL